MTRTVKIGIIGGTGLEDPKILRNSKIKAVNDTPFGKPSDTLTVGQIGGVDCVILPRHGRKHSVAPGNINYRANIWALKEEGCTHILASAATGSLREEIRPGEIVIVDSFIDRTQGRAQSFYDGEPNHPPGICHLPMEPAFDERTRQFLIHTARDLKLAIHEKGTAVTIEGPRYSSKAESSMYRQLGADLIGMTLVPEVVLAKEVGICYACIALITDYDCWRDNQDEHVSSQAVVENFKRHTEKVTSLITTVIPKIAADNWEQTLAHLENVVKKSII